MAKSEKPAKPAKAKKQSRRSQVAASYRMTKQADPRIGLILLLTFVVAGGIAYLLTWLLLGGWIFPVLNGILIGLLAALIVFGRRAQASAYKQIEGQPGAAAAALEAPAPVERAGEELRGVEWRWQSFDCAMGKARHGGIKSDRTQPTGRSAAASAAC